MPKPKNTKETGIDLFMIRLGLTFFLAAGWPFWLAYRIFYETRQAIKMIWLHAKMDFCVVRSLWNGQ
jgi:hypothetical protein